MTTASASETKDEAKVEDVDLVDVVLEMLGEEPDSFLRESVVTLLAQTTDMSRIFAIAWAVGLIRKPFSFAALHVDVVFKLAERFVLAHEQLAKAHERLVETHTQMSMRAGEYMQRRVDGALRC